MLGLIDTTAAQAIEDQPKTTCECVAEPCDCTDDIPVQQGGVKYFGDQTATTNTPAQEFDVVAWIQNNKTTVAVGAGALLLLLLVRK